MERTFGQSAHLDSRHANALHRDEALPLVREAFFGRCDLRGADHW